jgi:hypothetical protein
MTTVAWVLLVAALILLAVGVVSYRRGRRRDEGQTSAILSFVVGADLLVFALLSG